MESEFPQPEPPQPAVKVEKQQTEYAVLIQVDADGERTGHESPEEANKPSFWLPFKKVRAPGALQARRQALAESEYEWARLVAVPARSWTPDTHRKEQKIS